MQARRLDPAQPKTYLEARRTTDIFNGTLEVPELKDHLTDNIGHLGDEICPGCDALHWPRETSQTCCGWRCPCSKGKFNCDCSTMCQNPDKQVDGGCCGLKVHLPPFPTLPEPLRKLWFHNSHEAKLFRANARSFNNALALSSIKVRERRFQQGFCPNVIFQGKVHQYSGPLQAENGEDPKFAQLYVKDPALEIAHRQGNMSIPSSMSQQDRQIVYVILHHLQELLKEINPYVKDFRMICEIPEEDLLDGQLVISAKARPADGHERCYNLQTVLSEVSILTNCHPHDLVVKIRGGGLQSVSCLLYTSPSPRD